MTPLLGAARIIAAAMILILAGCSTPPPPPTATAQPPPASVKPAPPTAAPLPPTKPGDPPKAAQPPTKPAEKPAQAPAPTAAPPPPAAPPKPAEKAPAVATGALSADAIVAGLRASGFPIRDVKVLNAETDPNKLLGRPNQYIAKVAWVDDRSKNDDQTIEVFPDEASMRARAQYVEGIAKSGPLFNQYIYPNAARRALLRVPKELTPDQAKAYEAWFAKL